MYDVVIIGSGPAGMAAAVYAARAELTFVVVEKDMSGGQILETSEIDNYPGYPSISGFELAEKFRAHAEACGTEIIENITIEDFRRIEGGYELVFDGNKTMETKTILIATGAKPRRLGCPGEEELTGAGVSYCATCDGAFFKGRDVIVVGGGNTAVEDAIFLARGCKSVTLVHRRDSLRASRNLVTKLKSLPNVEIVWDSTVERIYGNGMVESVLLRNVKTGELTDRKASGVFVAVGTKPSNLGWQDKIPCDEGGYFIAGENCETQVPGIFAAGDVRTKSLRQVITAAADGANAIYRIEQYLAEQE
ncbi:MAG: thioredoxin-disulfide reductase [Lachnospiraceae bacterium]|nr:thioredoxin-disulfide reductase [Lachnospiraceae bacterium]